jgi:alanyl aminopeptidase
MLTCPALSFTPAGDTPKWWWDTLEYMHFARTATLFAWAAIASISLAAEAPALKLGYDVRPARYAADLTLLTNAPGFSGHVDIDVTLAKPASLIWLNATAIQIRRAFIVAGGKTQEAAVEPGNDNFVGLRVPAELPAGAAKIHIEYEGKISDKNSAGVFRGTEGGEKYLYTQFESTDARRAFPCFDQPDFKTPWQLTLHIRKDELAVSNTPQASETEEANGMKRVVFAPTQPLPSYLIAFAVGHFDIVDGGTTGRNHVRVRIITPKGKAAQAKYAAEVTGTIIQQLENYFGIPYPFPKADQVAIPLTFGFGAMENAGMVTYAQTLILSDPALDTVARQREYASVAAHELAHQWFGDLVTLKWWDDTWLNEAFATWTSSKILAEWKPEWNTRLGDLGSKFGAMTEDSLVSTRQIRQPIKSMDDISNAFDDITYEKGAAVIRMFESWVGEKQFRAGVTSYLKRYANGNATESDFLNAISAGGKPQLTSAFSTFLEQPGVPEISVQLNCSAAPALEVSQKRYLPIGSAGTRSETWQVPVCVRYPSSNGPQKECFLLTQPKAEFPLSKATGCPAYVSANDSAAGYYVTAYSHEMLQKLLGSGGDFLDPAERRTLLHDLSSLVTAGDAKESEALAAVPSFARARERQIVTQAQGVAGSIDRLVPGNLRPNYARYIEKAFGARAAELGWSAKPGETAETGLLRASLVPFVAVNGDDPKLQREARQLADEWLKVRKGIDSNMLAGVLTTAAHFGDRALFDTMLQQLKSIQDRHQRQTLIGALGSFRDPQIAQAAMALVLRPDMDPRETMFVLFGPLSDRQTQRLPFDFVKTHYDELLKRLPSGGGFDAGATLPMVGGGFCDETSRKEFVSFFQDRAKKFIGGPRNYAQALEGIRLCEAQKAAQGADVAAFLEKQ